MNCRYLAITSLFLLKLATLDGQTTVQLTEALHRLSFPAVAQSEQFSISPLVPGNSYVLTLMDGINGAYELQNLVGGEYSSETYFFNQPFVATSTEATFQINRRFGFLAVDELRLSVADLTRLQSSQIPQRVSQVPDLARSMMMGINAVRNSNAELLVNSIFRNQSCFETSNYAYNGVSGFFPPLNDTVSQLGTFTNGSSSINLDEGIVLVNGVVREVNGPNTFFAQGQGFNVISTDPDAIQLAAPSLPYDVVSIEFDFIPTTSQINFNYVFASEEYCSQLGNQTSDAFAFLISGPGISGPFSNNAMNIATLPPGSTLPGGQNTITVNSINPFVNAHLFNSNTEPNEFDNCNNLLPVALNEIEFDGFTDVLTASANVIPCEVYHLKLIIIDVQDAFTNSAVFLQRGSFASGLVNVSDPTASAQNNNLANAPIEGCSDGELIFSRLTNDVSQPVTVYFNISTQSTATFGVDYVMPLDSIIIPAGQLSDTLIIDIFGDNLAEGTETIVIQVTGTCNCEDFSSEFFIVDPPLIDLQLNTPLEDCVGTLVDLAPIVTGGQGSYTFNWSTGSIDSVITATRLAGDSLYVLSVMDECQQLVMDTAIVSAPDIRAVLTGEYPLCDAPSLLVPIAVSGGTNYTITVLENGVPATYSGTGDTIRIPYTTTTNLSLVSVEADGCSGMVQGTARVIAPQFSVTAATSNVSCRGGTNGSLDLTVNGNSANFSFAWANPSLTGASLSNLSSATYPVQITDTLGCTFDTSFVITQPDQELLVSLDSVRNQNCLQAAYLAVSVHGGTAPYQLSWQDNNSTAPVRDNLPGGLEYILTTTDQAGCTRSDTFHPLDERTTVLAAIAAPENQLSCTTTSITLTATPNNPQPVDYQWFNPQGATIGAGTSVVATTSGTYRLSVTDPANSCTATADFSITRTADSLALDLPNYQIDCGNSFVDLEVTATNFSGPVTYTWFNEAMVQIGTGPILPSVTSEGTYTVSGVRTDNGCETRVATQVLIDVERPVILADFSTRLTCAIDTATLQVQVQNVTNPAYNWRTTDGNFTGSNTDASLAVTQPGTYTVRVTNLDNECFTEATDLLLFDDRTLMANAGVDQLLRCGTDPNELTGSSSPVLAGTSYRWLSTTGEELAAGSMFLPMAGGQFTLEVTHPETGCISIDEVTIQNEGPTGLMYTIQQPPCVEIGGTITVTEVMNGRPPFQFFLDGQLVAPANSGSLSGIEAGFHDLTVVDVNGCTHTEEIQLTEPAVFTGNAPDQEIRLGEVAVLGITTNRDQAVDQLIWNAPIELSCLACPNPEASPLSSFIADVLVIDDAGCELRLRQNVYVDERNLVYLPNAFSPGIRDGFNDRFVIYADPRFVTSINYLAIYDRWGNAVFIEQDFLPSDENKGWDGTVRGREMPSGAYVFVTEVTLWDGRKELFRGTVNLVR